MTSVDVADEAGVSQATVARTFSSPHLVSEATRSRVHEAAQRIGYVPNAIARSLKSQRTNIVGAVVPAYGEYWQSVLTEFSRQLAELDRQLLLFSFSDPDQVETMLHSVRQYRLDGLILASATIGHAQLATMMSTELPTVAFNQPAATGVINSVSVDNESGMAAIADHLADLDCSRILYVGGVSTTSTDQLRYQGAARSLGSRGIACPYLEAGAFSYEAGYKAAAAVIEREDLPQAVMVASDEVAFGLLDGLQEAGVAVPDDLLLTGFDGLPQAAWARYDLTTLVQPTSVLVQRALEALLVEHNGEVADEGAATAGQQLHGAPSSPAEIVVTGTLRLGRTSSPSVESAESLDESPVGSTEEARATATLSHRQR